MKKNLFVMFLAIFTNMLMAQKEQQQIGAVEGADGIFIFYADEFIGTGNSKGVTSVTISRSDNGGASWTDLGKQSAVYDIAVLKSRFGNDFPQITASYLKLKDESMLIDYFKQHPAISDYGFLAFDLYFMQASGAVFFDKNKPAAGAKIKYKVRYQKADGSFLADEPTSDVTIGTPLGFNRLRAAGRTERDSSISVSWKAMNKETDPFFFGNVYRQSGGSGAYTYAGKVMPATEKDSAVFTFYEKVSSNGLYKYFIRPTNMVGLEGVPSDTIAVIAADFAVVPKLENFQANDTSGGIYFSWTALPANVLYSGIAIQRKPMNDKDFLSIDTIPTNSSTYIDGRVVANIAYQYQFRLVNLRWKPLPPSATATVVHRTGSKNRLVPYVLAAKSQKGGIKVSWQKIKHYDINGYYVYRSMNGSEYKLVSGLLKDTIYLDTDATDGRGLYSYQVTSLNFGDVQSDKSNSVQGRSENKTIPLAPKGIVTSTEAGKVNLMWTNTKQSDALINGYFVYRAEGSVPFNKNYSAPDLQQARFIKLNNNPVASPVFADTKTEPAKTYTYAVTSVDVLGVESNAEQLVEVKSASVRIAAPSFFSLVKTSGGVQLSWNAELNKSVTDYSIYRRLRTETIPQLVGTVKASQLNYTDTKAAPGTFYFYSVKAKSSSGSESDFSPEKGIVR